MRVCLLATSAQILIRGDELAAAFPYCKEANDLAVETLAEDDLIRGYAQAAYGCYLAFYKVPDLAIPPLEASIVSLKKLESNDLFSYRKVLWILLDNQIRLGLLEEAHLHYEAHIAELGVLNDFIGLSKAHNTYGFYLQNMGYHDQAIAAFDRGLQVLSSINYDEALIWVVNILESKVHSLKKRGEFEVAISYFERAYFARKSSGRYDWSLQVLKYIIGTLLEMQQYQRALAFFEKERAYVNRAEGLTSRNHKLYLYLGQLFAELGDPGLSKQYYDEYNEYIAQIITPTLEKQLRPPKDLREQLLLQKNPMNKEC